MVQVMATRELYLVVVAVELLQAMVQTEMVDQEEMARLLFHGLLVLLTV